MYSNNAIPENISRNEIIEILSQTLSTWEYVDAARLLGSDAFNRSDELSDIDIRAVVFS